MFFLTNPLRLHSGPLQFPNLKFHRAFFHVCLTGPTMKWLCLGTIGVAGLALLLCALDLITGVPFGGGFSTDGPYTLADIGGILAAGITMYLGFNAYKDVK